MSTEPPSAKRTIQRSASPSSTVQTLLIGKGSPRIALRPLMGAAVWAMLCWFLYPYALGVATWQGSARYVGVVLLLLVAFLIYLLLRAIGRVLWHLGLIWLLVILCVAFLGATTARGRALGASTPNDWGTAGLSIAQSIGETVQQVSRGVVGVPEQLYAAITQQPPPWQPKAEVVLEPATVGVPAEGNQLILPSEREPGGITRGVLVRIVTDDGSAVNGRAQPGIDSPAVTKFPHGTFAVVTDGPRQIGDQIWWQVDDQGIEGWCAAEFLRP